MAWCCVSDPSTPVLGMLSQVLTRKEQLVLLFLGGSICLGSIVLYTVSSQSEANEAAETVPAPPPSTLLDPSPPDVVSIPESPESAATQLSVAVVGAVRAPGVFQFEEGARIQEAIDAAGGTEPWANLSDINRAAPLIDGTTLTVPGEPEAEADVIRRRTPPPPNPPQYTVSGWQPGGSMESIERLAGPAAAGSGGIDLNRATAAQLETLPGIGPKLASEIIRHREHQPFRTVDELDLVNGIGPKRLEAVRGLVTVAP